CALPISPPRGAGGTFWTLSGVPRLYSEERDCASVPRCHQCIEVRDCLAGVVHPVPPGPGYGNGGGVRTVPPAPLPGQHYPRTVGPSITTRWPSTTSSARRVYSAPRGTGSRCR